MRILSIRGIALGGPEQIDLRMTAKLDFSLKDVQEGFSEKPIDPFELENLKAFMPMLKDHFELQPFKVEDVEFLSITQEDITVSLRVSISVEHEIKDEDELKKKYTALLEERLKADPDRTLEDVRDGFLGKPVKNT